MNQWGLPRRRGLICQILSITCDNASANDAMIDALSGLVVAFPGAANRTRCFTHILNLVVKVILGQFDMPKSTRENVLDGALQALRDLAGNFEMEEAIMDERDKDNDDKDDNEGDPRAWLSVEEQDELDVSVHPVRLVLVKVSSNSEPLNWQVTHINEPNLAPKTCVLNQELLNDSPPSLDSNPRRSSECCYPFQVQTSCRSNDATRCCDTLEFDI